MKTLKRLLFVILMGLLMVTPAMSDEKAAEAGKPGPTPVYKAGVPVVLQAGEYDLQTTILEFPPGAAAPKHMHGGYVLVTVLQGEMTLIDKSGERVLRVGESWTESPGDQHSVVNAGTAPARVVVNMLLPKGAEATTVIKQ